MVSSTLLDVEGIFQRFNLDPVCGFVTNIDRAHKRLSKTFAMWEHIGTDLQALTTSGKLRDLMPLLDVEPLLGDSLACERAHMLLAFITNCYVRGRMNDTPLDRIPKGLADPLIRISEAIGTVPLLTYADTVLFNFRIIDPTQPFSLEYLTDRSILICSNVWTIITASGSIDESWFYMVSVAMEALSGDLIRLFIDIANAARTGDHMGMKTFLDVLSERISDLEKILMRMYEENLPAIFYQRIRRYLSGWLNDDQLPNGVYYGEEDIPRQYAGGSNSQSPMIQALDIVLGIRHTKSDHHDTGLASAGAYLLEMRQYMSKEHRNFLAWLQENVNIHAIVSEPNVPETVINAYNGCLTRLREFRNKHLAIVCAYVSVQSKKADGMGTLKGSQITYG